MQASLDVRAELQKVESNLIALQNKRAQIDAASNRLIQSVVNNIKGDLTEGDDGDLYEAMGYTRRSERKSGRKGAAA